MGQPAPHSLFIHGGVALLLHDLFTAEPGLATLLHSHLPGVGQLLRCNQSLVTVYHTFCLLHTLMVMTSLGFSGLPPPAPALRNSCPTARGQEKPPVAMEEMEQRPMHPTSFADLQRPQPESTDLSCLGHHRLTGNSYPPQPVCNLNPWVLLSWPPSMVLGSYPCQAGPLHLLHQPLSCSSRAKHEI